MAWSEMSGKRDIIFVGEGGAPHYVDFIVSFVGVEGTENTPGFMPVPGNTLAIVAGSGTFGTTYGNTTTGTAISLDGEATAVQVSESHKLNEKRCSVTVRFRAYAKE